ncbi:MAG: Flagellar hook-length control protein FliK [Polyangiaceae bacterium]|nr:Flagellar hook-length control protein FliK [Polyangiaceae bacterium]
MNSSGTSAGGLNTATRQLEREETSNGAREQGSEQAAALWVALAEQVQGAQKLPALETVSEPPSAWRSSAGDMTPAPAAAPASGGAPVDAKPPERMTLRVDGGALGELEVTLDRQEGGMRVVIGMENKQLVGSILPDAASLRSALERAGINVQSLNVVTQSEVGTVLAQRRLSSSGQDADAAKRAEQDPEKAQTRTSKRLTLIG